MSERTLLGGTDGFRGPVALENPAMGHQNELTHYWLTAALVSLQQEAGQEGPVVVLRDTRPSGSRLAQANIRAALDQGAEVESLNIAATPVGQKVAELSGAIATVAVTASHNPVGDNGWKGMLGSHKPGKDWVQKISDRAWDMYDERKSELPAFPITEPYVDLNELNHKRQYKEMLVGRIESTFGGRPLDGKTIVYDGANGAGTPMTPDVLETLGATVHRINCGDGIINDRCGATHLGSLKDYIAAHPQLLDDPNFLGGVANDGDADRLMAVGVIKRGSEVELVDINGNHAMYQLAQGQPGIVGTLYTNTGLRDKLREQAIEFEECDNGDKYVTQALQNRADEGWSRGGEFTGHLIDMSWLNSGDGIAMAAWLSASVARQDSTFGELYNSVPLWQESMSSIKLADGMIIPSIDPRLAEAQDWAVEQMAGEGRAIIRPSGTEPVVRVWLESPHKAFSAKVGEALRFKLQQELLSA